MSTPQEPATADTAPDQSRSGNDVAEAIEVAERGSSVQEVHDRPGDTRSGTAPVEHTRGDREMTEGQVVQGEGEGGSDAPVDPRSAGSGGAQSAPGARMPDRRAAGRPEPEGPPFD